MNLGIERTLGLVETKPGTFLQHTDLSRVPFCLSSTLEAVLSNSKVDYDESTLRGYVGELSSRNLLEGHLRRNYGSIRYMDVLNLNQGGYVIGQTKDRVLKASNDGNVVLLEDSGDKVSGKKMGYQIISEIDGLFCVVDRSDSEKRKKEYILIESKTGKVGLKSEHIFNNIIRPYFEILQSPIHYLLIDFREKLFEGRKRKILRKCYRDNLYLPLRRMIKKLDINSSVG